jgi:hypothetical protein
VFKDLHLNEACTVCWNQYIIDKKLGSIDVLKQQSHTHTHTHTHTHSHELCVTVS